MTDRPLTGRHVLAMFVGGFGIIIAVNVALAVNAVRTFPGLEVANSYVASQEFEARRSAQQALGWQADAAYETGVLTLHVTGEGGRALDPTLFAATIGRPTMRAADAPISFDATGEAPIDLAPGRWRLDLHTSGDAPAFAQSMLIELGK